ncbi:hypothetical protein HZS_2427 [Henneguya salminicola]|nr:hypothetical protein HZS_2427 [Henneguya salminicola]
MYRFYDKSIAIYESNTFTELKKFEFDDIIGVVDISRDLTKLLICKKHAGVGDYIKKTNSFIVLSPGKKSINYIEFRDNI